MSSSQFSHEGPGPLRTDAERNRAAVVSAARAVFAEAGTDVPTSRIARRAGVAVATLYRRYPTREALVEAAFAEHHEECAQFLTVAESDPDPWSALRRAIRVFCADQVHDRGFTALLVPASGRSAPGVLAEFATATARLDTLLRRARATGAIHDDLGLAELQLLVAGNAGVIASCAPGRAAAASARYVDLVLRSFETGSGGTPGNAVSGGPGTR